MLEPSLRQLRTLLAVIETGGVTAAAHQLGITQPAASQQLRGLERSLGVRLLDRAGGRSFPTAAGQVMLQPTRRALAAVADARAAAGFRAGNVGRVRIGTGATACIYLLLAVLAAAKRRMPGLEVIVATGNTAVMVEQVEAGDLDLAVVTLPTLASKALCVTPLLTDPFVALIPEFMTPAAAPAGDTVDPAMLAAMPPILYEPGGSTRLLIDGWFRGAGLTVSPVMQLDSVEAIKVLVGGGAGASVLPALALPAPMPGAVTRSLRPAAQRELAIVLRWEKIVDRGLRIMLDALASAPGAVYNGSRALRGGRSPAG
jgi:DNA-binding transcriptional LysR family regulator